MRPREFENTTELDCGCRARWTWRVVGAGRATAVAVPDGARIVETCDTHVRLEGTSFELDDSPFLH